MTFKGALQPRLLCERQHMLQPFNPQRYTPGYSCGENGPSCPAFQIVLLFEYTLLILISNTCHSIALVLLNLLRALSRELFKCLQSCLLWNRSIYSVTRGKLLFCVLLWVWTLRSFDILTLRHHLSNLVGKPSKFVKVLQHCFLRLSSTQERHCLGKACTGFPAGTVSGSINHSGIKEPEQTDKWKMR